MDGEMVWCWVVGSQEVVVVLDVIGQLLRDLSDHRRADIIAADVHHLRRVFLRRRGRTRDEVVLLSRATLVAIQVGELFLAQHELTTEFWSENRAFASVHDVGAFACRKTLHVLRRCLEDQDGSVIAGEALDAIGRDTSFACFLAHGASVRSERVRRCARMLAFLTGVSLAPDEWRWSSLLPPRSTTGTDHVSCEDGGEVGRRGE